MQEYVLKKSYDNHYGLDLKSNDLTRPDGFVSGMKNAQYRKNGAPEKRKGYQGHAASAGGHGLFTYNRINPTTLIQEPQVVSISNKPHKLLYSTLIVTYVGVDPTSIISIFYDKVTAEYRCQITEGTALVLDMALGKGFDEATPVTINDLRAAIDALANYTATVTGATTTPAAFIKIVRDEDLSDGVAYSAQACYWADINTPIATPFAGSTTHQNDDDFENASAVQLNNVLYLANGYDETQKYDGQNCYRAGVPQPATLTSALGGAGAITGTNYYHLATYVQIDAVGNVNEGNLKMVTAGLNPVAQSMNVTVANVLAASGFNTNCAIVNGAQVAVNTITVDDGAGGAATIKVGDTAYFFDAVSASYVERLVTAIAATTITVAGAAVTVADNAVISNNLRIAVYRNLTSAVTPTTFYLVEEIPNNSFAATQVYNDNKTDAQLGAQFIEPLVDRGLPPKGKYISAFRNQMVLGGKLDDQNSVFFSDVESPEYFPFNNTFPVDTIQGDVIRGLAPNNELFAIFKTRSIHVVSGDIASNNIRVDQLTNDVGCEAHASIKEVKGSLFFLTDKGPYFMTGGQIPLPLGENRIEPVFAEVPVNPELALVLRRSVAIHDNKDEKYVLFIPAESAPANRHTNANSRIFTFDYSRGAWLEWSNMDFTGGATIAGNETYFSERRLSTFTSAVEHILYRRHTLDDAWSYEDNTDPIDWQYDPQWEAMGEPSVFKKFLSLRLFALENIPNNDLVLNVKTEVNYIRDAAKADFNLSFMNSGYGVSPYGTSPYGDPAEQTLRHKLGIGKFRSLRLRFSNNRDQENVAITGWELQVATGFKPKFKL